MEIQKKYDFPNELTKFKEKQNEHNSALIIKNPKVEFNKDLFCSFLKTIFMLWYFLMILDCP